MVIGGDFPIAGGLVLRGELLCGLELPVGGIAQTTRLAAGLLVALAGELLLPAVLALAVRNAARPHCGGWREDEDALRAEGVEEVAVVAYDKSSAAE